MSKFPNLKMEYHSEDERSLIAIQGPKAQYVVEQLMDGNNNLTNMDFMEST